MKFVEPDRLNPSSGISDWVEKEREAMMGDLFRMTDGEVLYIIHGPNGEEEVVRGVLLEVTTPLYAVCGRCGGHGETVTDGIGENCCNCDGGGYVAFNSAAVKGET